MDCNQKSHKDSYRLLCPGSCSLLQVLGALDSEESPFLQGGVAVSIHGTG